MTALLTGAGDLHHAVLFFVLGQCQYDTGEWLHIVLFWFDRIVGLSPGLKPAFEGVNVLETMTQQNLRCTSARRLVLSGAIGDDKPVLG